MGVTAFNPSPLQGEGRVRVIAFNPSPCCGEGRVGVEIPSCTNLPPY